MVLQALSPTAPERPFLIELHVSLGLTSLIPILLFVLFRVAAKPPPLPEDYPRGLRHFGNISYGVMYLCMLIMPISGYLQTVFQGLPLKFWGFPLPLWGGADAAWAEFFWISHGVVAFVLTVFLAIHSGIVLIGSIKKYGIGARMLPGETYESSELAELRELPPAVAGFAHKLCFHLKIFGWVGFWTQLALAFVSGLLLVFASSGRSFSPGTTALGDGMFWATAAFIPVWVAIPLAVYYTRAAKKVTSAVQDYLDPERKLAFWFLAVGILAGIFGVLASIIGVAASISLLIAKTVSQPPGIAITDPNKIIRALDVFILVVNFNLLISHFIGTSISLWLGILAARARLAFLHRGDEVDSSDVEGKQLAIGPDEAQQSNLSVSSTEA